MSRPLMKHREAPDDRVVALRRMLAEQVSLRDECKATPIFPGKQYALDRYYSNIRNIREEIEKTERDRNRWPA